MPKQLGLSDHGFGERRNAHAHAKRCSRNRLPLSPGSPRVQSWPGKPGFTCRANERPLEEPRQSLPSGSAQRDRVHAARAGRATLQNAGFAGRHQRILHRSRSPNLGLACLVVGPDFHGFSSLFEINEGPNPETWARIDAPIIPQLPPAVWSLRMMAPDRGHPRPAHDHQSAHPSRSW